jgi:hypothetical protein
MADRRLMRHRILIHNDRRGSTGPQISAFNALATITINLDHTDPSGGRSFQIDLTNPVKDPNNLLLDIYPPPHHTMAIGGELIRSIQLVIAPEAPRS